MKIKEVLEKTIIKLKENNIEEVSSKARRLLAYTLGVSKEYLIINDDKELSFEEEYNYNEKIKELINSKPIQYIIGKQEFMGIEFKVNEKVLIPQPDTEILVEETIKIAQQYSKPRILDLCTGSGAIAISIAKYCPEAEITASDISKEALNVAKENDINNELELIHSNLFENIKEKFNIIVSNPPYIKTEEIELLSKEVQNEPRLALDGGQDGLDCYKKIINESHKFLVEDGYLCLEIGETQKDEIVDLINSTKQYIDIKVYKDIAKNDRVIVCKTMTS